jgi:pyruvate dehydrogenase E1 component beta subunit
LGKAAVTREGNDVSLITYGRTVLDAIDIAEQLAKDDISVEVIDLRTIAPYDEETVMASVRKTGRAVVLHEAVKAYGTGAEISARLHEKLFNDLKAPVQRVGGAFSAVPMANCLEQAWIPGKDAVKAAIHATLDWKK